MQNNGTDNSYLDKTSARQFMSLFQLQNSNTKITSLLRFYYKNITSGCRHLK